ncbi:hypothetical protein N5J66_10550 [Pseudomonas juntendi]|uniref:hypothetical protein n=1 Tax=Pseudomonas juntendi TaxID=2666183 RepID=UPI00244D6D16|nr:hypothetical protein [Pseudomonas juntendi]MDH2014398.1 hypothetical protein [Pseudomonas juntendi]
MTDKVQWKTLPTKANQDMEKAGAEAAGEFYRRTGSNNLWVIYEAMVAAAPKPPASTEPVVVALVAEDRNQLTDVIQCGGIHSLPVGTELIDRAAYDLSKAEVLHLVAALDLIGHGLSVADGAKNVDAMRQEIHELQERDLDQLALLVEAREILQRQAAAEKLRGSSSSAAELERLAKEIGVHSIEPITDGTKPLSRLALQREIDRLKTGSHWEGTTNHSLREQLQEHEDGRLQLKQEARDLEAELAKAKSLLHTASIHLAQWVGMDDKPRQQIIEFLEGIDTPVELDERAAFEKFCVDSFNRCCNPNIPITMELMLAARRGEKYSATGWSNMWKGWNARAALEKNQ